MWDGAVRCITLLVVGGGLVHACITRDVPQQGPHPAWATHRRAADISSDTATVPDPSNPATDINVLCLGQPAWPQ